MTSASARLAEQALRFPADSAIRHVVMATADALREGERWQAAIDAQLEAIAARQHALEAALAVSLELASRPTDLPVFLPVRQVAS